MPTPEKLQAAHDRAAQALAGLEKMFTREMRLTFIARDPENVKASMLVTSDTIEGIEQALAYLKTRPA
jgi:hypothetical protein